MIAGGNYLAFKGFLYKRLAKLAEVAPKKDIENAEELNYIRTISENQVENNRKLNEMHQEGK